MATLIELARTLMDRRTVLAAELAAIDSQLGEARQLLGIEIPTVTVQATSLDEEIAKRVPHENAPAAVDPDPLAGPIEKICALCGRPFSQRSNRQKLCVACRASHPNRSVEELAKRDRLAKPLEPKVLRAHDLPIGLRPAARVKPAPVDDDDLETVWTPGRDAPSLSGEGLGSSLADLSPARIATGSRHGGSR